MKKLIELYKTEILVEAVVNTIFGAVLFLGMLYAIKCVMFNV